MATQQTGYALALFALALTACTRGTASVDASVRDASEDIATLHDIPEELGAARDVADVVEGDRIDSGPPDDRPALMDVIDVVRPGCVPGMSVACACADGRTGAQVCLPDNTFGSCTCTGQRDAGASPDVVLPPLGARLIAPQSVSRVTSRRPTLRWVLPTGITRARVTLCADRPCARVLQRAEVAGTSWRSATLLAPGVVFWHIEGLTADGAVGWTSATWEFVVGHRDAPVDTSFGSLRDFDGDGFDDFAVVESSGRFTVQMHWGTGNRDAVPSYTLMDDRIVGGKLTSGDFNGDGLTDLARNRDEQAEFWVRYGAIAQRNVSVTTFRHPFLMGVSSIGTCTPVAADLNGDGFSDLTFVCNEERGAVAGTSLRVYLGSSLGISQTPTLFRGATEAGAHRNDLDRHAIAGGDVNNDGYADILTSTFWDDNGNVTRTGPAWIVLGDPTAALRWWVPLHSPTGHTSFADHIGAPGDVNGDGVADFAFTTGEGALLYLGREGGFPSAPIQTIRAPSDACGTYWGSRWGLAGDYDGDGRADLTIGAPCYPRLGPSYRGPGAAFVYPGMDGGVATNPIVMNGLYPDDLFTWVLGGVGDYDGDGFSDLMVMKPNISIGWDSMMTEDRLPGLYMYWGGVGSVSSGSLRVIRVSDISGFRDYLASVRSCCATRS